MKVLPFNIPVAHDKTVIVQQDVLPYFYQHLHRHEEIQLTLVQKGHGKLTIGENEHDFYENEAYLIGANMPHVFRCPELNYDKDENVQALTIYFNPRGLLSNIFNLPEFKSINSFFLSGSSYRVPKNELANVSKLMLSMNNTARTAQLLQFFELLTLLQELQHTNPLSAEGSTAIADNMRMDKVYTYIIKNYHQDITLEDVAEHAHLTPSSFCRYFKKHTRLTFVEFLNKVRINEACKKLTSGTYTSVAEVALNCGYSSSTNFNRVFRSVTGLSPTLYVKGLAN